MPGKILFRIETNAQQVGKKIEAIQKRLARLPELAGTMTLKTWRAVNAYLEGVVVAEFIANRDSIIQQDSTERRKRADVKRGSVRWSPEAPKAAFITEYGQSTGWWESIYRKHAEVGKTGRLIRTLMDSPTVRQGRFQWGVNIPMFDRGYPAGILKPGRDLSRAVSTTGSNDALISVNKQDIQYIYQLIASTWIVPMFHRAGFRSAT